MPLLLSLFTIFVFSTAHSQELPPEPISGQRASGIAAGDLQWNVYFNFPRCDHQDQKLGAWCAGEDYTKSLKSNGVDTHLKKWITNPQIKSIYMSYFSFSNKSIMKALCYETGKRDLNVQVYLDAGAGQVDGFLSNVQGAEGSLMGTEGYVPGCKERIYDKMKKRGSGGCCSRGYFLQHSKIFLALEKEELFKESWQLGDWLADAGRIRFTSSSANMSGNGTALHFENWMFFNAPPKDHVALQNICSLWSFGQVNFYDDSSQDISKQRKEFKSAYSGCISRIDRTQSPRRSDMSFYMVPSYDNNSGYGPSGALKKMLRRYGRNRVRVAIHRLTTSAVRTPLIRAQNRGARVSVLLDDDSLRSSLEGAGSGLDVNYLDASNYRKLDRAGLDIRFVETNGDSFRHLFHNKFIIADDKRLFQGAGNFTGTALNAFNSDGNFEQFYVVKNKDIVKAYVEGWKYLRSISTEKSEHPEGGKPNNCALFSEEGGLPGLVSCDTPGAENY